MLEVLSYMAALMACGAAWRSLKPGGVDPETLRHALTGLVYYLLLPAVVIDTLWRAPLDLDTLRIAVSAAASIALSMGLALLAYRALRIGRPDAPTAGALILAASFPNAVYLGLPVLERLLGSEEGRALAIQYDVFGAVPLLFTLGVLVAQRHGTRRPGPGNPPAWQGLLRVPSLWAALVAMTLNLLEVPMPGWPREWLGMLAAAVVPLMLFSLGLGLRLQEPLHRRLPLLVPVLVIQLALMPALTWALATGLGLSGDRLLGLTLEGAMPSMVVGVILCDRFGLNTTLYASAVTVCTLASLVTLPLWYAWLT